MAMILGKSVGPVGFGLMGFTWRAPHLLVPLEDAIAVLKTALNKGMNLWNGGEFYGTPEYNSMTLLKAYFTRYPEDADKVVIVMKGATKLDTLGPDGSPEAIRRSIDAMIDQLGGTKKIDVFQCARRDPNFSLKETLELIQREYIDTGKIGGVGLSECSAETVREAAKYAKIAVVEVELSLFTPDILHNGIAAASAEHNIPILAYAPMGRGILAGKYKDPAAKAQLDMLARFPRFQGEALDHNQKLFDQLLALAEKKGHTPAQLAISWAQNLGGSKPGLPTIIPIPGATTLARIEENSQLISLTEGDMKELSDLSAGFKTLGERYPAGAAMNT